MSRQSNDGNVSAKKMTEIFQQKRKTTRKKMFPFTVSMVASN